MEEYYSGLDMIATEGREFDVILISGEPYVDHPLSAVGVIARVLDAKGYRVGVIGRPDWKRDTDFLKLGKPRLYFGLTSGSMDSLLVNYTPLKRRRAEDPHEPYCSGIPDRAVLVYANKIKHLFPGSTIVLGGIEASLRRLAHYDYWENKVRRSLLLDSRADVLVYGPGELQAVEIARRLGRGEDLSGIPGTCVVRREVPAGFALLPSFEEVSQSAEKFCEAQRLFSNRRPLAQTHGGRFVLQFPLPQYTSADLDWIYGLPYSREIPEDFPEFSLVRFSVVTHRGCIGNCSFCSLALHQGDRIVSRSEESIVAEIRRLTNHPEFKGYVDDLGGPTANMYGMDCAKPCQDGECLQCSKLDRSHKQLIRLMKRSRAIAGVKKVFVRSGIRYDLALESPEYVRELCNHHISGLLKIAPEHISPRVLRWMNKGRQPLAEFRRLFQNQSRGRNQHLKYYFMVGHPGTGPAEARQLAQYLEKLRKEGEKPLEGVQIFTPTPMTRSTCMYYTGTDPMTGESVYVPRTFSEKKEQKRILPR
jgi:uncharacterized radical SAM protein YgiQ